jgi:outer membrane putative beta-barrel porin/alpha-amylase
LEAKDLRGGDIKFYTGYTFGTSFSVFFEDSLDLKLSTDTVGLFATYGVTDRLDLGVAVPIMNVQMRTELTTRVGTSETGINPQPTFEPQVVRDSASGIGDIVIRGKYSIWKAKGGGVAAGVDWRLPTGDEEELLGIAGAQGKFYVAASSAYGSVSPHFNLGFTVSGDTEAARSQDTFIFEPPDEVGYAAGVDVAVTSRLTLVGDIVGRNLRDKGKPGFDLRLLDVPTEFGGNYREWSTEGGNLSLLLGSVGVKFNPVSRGLISFNMLFPLNDRGLRDDLTLVGGFEWSF